MTIQQLEYVVALDKYRHFVSAAEACYITQPTLTMQLKKLEEEIGFMLFDRHSKPLKPTRQGEAYIAKARQIIREVRLLEESVKNEKESLAGHFKMAVIPTVAPYLIPRFIKTLIDENKALSFDIIELQTSEIIKSLRDETIDMGIVSTPLYEDYIQEVPLYYEPFLLYLPENHKLAKYDKIASEIISSKELLLLDEGHCFREQALQLCSLNKSKKGFGFTYKSGSIEALMNMVDRKFGYTLLPELAIEEKDISADRLKRFTCPEPIREISLVCHTSFAKTRLIEKITQSVIKNIPKNLTTTKDNTRIEWK
ncbi:MAG: LysR family transcriptional regulator [Bacteroidales bacterium]|nr:LysR family transcriptional regulator [Bacteroidales bacterium]MBN2820552.1 LysR family transcriptional regulator [Bacteroidales bacterium]